MRSPLSDSTNKPRGLKRESPKLAREQSDLVRTHTDRLPQSSTAAHANQRADSGLGGDLTNAALQHPLSRAAKLLRSSKRALLSTHVNPDGDAIGSVLALGLGLRPLGIDVDVVLADPWPDYCRFLLAIDMITGDLPSLSHDVAVVCDAAGLDRIGFVESAVRAATATIEIDHHAIARPFGQIRLIDETRSATAELVYDLLTVMGVPITPDIATCLMMGVVTDTGAFRFTNVNARVFELSATLMGAGADLDRIMDQVYDRKSVNSLRLLGCALAHLRSEDEFASATLSLGDFHKAKATQTDAEGVVQHLRSLADAKVAAVLREASPDVVRVSLRGRPGVNVAEIAARFGGGGHAAASGCTIYRPLYEAEQALRDDVLRVLGNGRGPHPETTDPEKTDTETSA